MPTPTPDADLLPRLRRCTGPLHERIEALLRLEAPMPLPRYGRVLRGFHEFLQLWEPRVRFALPEDRRAWFDARGRAALAARDLAALEVPPAPDLRQAARAAQALIHFDKPAVAWGALYVIEGSALGGQVLTPRLAALHDLSPERGAAYFHGFGARTGSMWREFRQLATEAVGTEDDALSAACRGAVTTFKALIAAFDALDVPDIPDAADAPAALKPSPLPAADAATAP